MNDIFIANGGFHALYFIANALLNPGDNILVPSIGYPYYQGLKDVLIKFRPNNLISNIIN